MTQAEYDITKAQISMIGEIVISSRLADMLEDVTIK
jgi:hypothetical protein